MFYFDVDKSLAKIKKELASMTLCQNCKWWDTLTSETDQSSLDRFGGRCRKSSPVISDDGYGAGAWPRTGSREWCGDFQKDVEQ